MCINHLSRARSWLDPVDALEADAARAGHGTTCLCLGLSVVAAIALSFNLARLRESFGCVAHANDVLRNIFATERALLEAESGERGYLLLEEGSYLDSCNRSQAEILRLLEALRQLVSDNPDQSQRLTELRAIIKARLDAPNPEGGTIFRFTLRGVGLEESDNVA